MGRKDIDDDDDVGDHFVLSISTCHPSSAFRGNTQDHQDGCADLLKINAKGVSMVRKEKER